MNAERTALIVGAGIGGLAAGLVLRRAGWNVRIHEQAAGARELGFGLGLAPNALAALRELGVAEPVVRAGATLSHVEFRRLNGRVLRTFKVAAGFPAVVALRPDLYGALLRAVGEDVLRLGERAVSFSQTGQGVTVHFANGNTDTGSLLVAADGVNSAIRRGLHPGESAPRPSGFCAIRGVAYGVGHRLGALSGIGYFDEAIEAATVRASGDAVYWYMSLRDADVIGSDPHATLERIAAACEPAFRAILTATKTEDVRLDRLSVRDPLVRWGRGRVTLLGDAAHPVLPHTGQGAAQALEDAVALGLALARGPAIEDALRRYEAVRSRRTRAFIKLGPRIARVTTTRNRLIGALRSLVLKSMPEPVLAWSVRSLLKDPHAELRAGL